MRIKFAIYGAGVFGKKLLDILGEDNVKCFIDRDERKRGVEYKGVPTISADEYIETDDTVCVITPRKDGDKIERELRTKCVKNILRQSSIDFMLFQYGKYILEELVKICKNQMVAVYGISTGSIVIAETISQYTQDEVILLPGRCQDGKKYDFLENNYSISDFETIKNKAVTIINTESYINSGKVRANIISVQNIFESLIQYRNIQITDLKNIHTNRRCFIVATGPSLRVSDLEILCRSGEICISMNRIYNIFDKTIWRPDYYVIEDPMTVRDLRYVVAELNIPVKFVPENIPEYWQNVKDRRSVALKYGILPSEEFHRPLFSENVDKIIYQGKTVTYACIQLAVHMGFKQIILIGVDYNYSSNIHDPSNHFDGYEKDGETTVNPFFPEKSGLAYQGAREYAEAHGISILNATRGGKLEYFERVDFDSLFD